MSDIVTTIETISPGVAKSYLEKNKCNRSMSRLHKDKLSRAMQAGEFRTTHQGIAFDVNGDLVDGQHRLTAVVDSGKTVTMLVTRGLPMEAKPLVDNQIRTRSIFDGLSMAGDTWISRDAVTVSRLWMQLLSQGRHSTPSYHEVRDFIDGHKDSIHAAITAARGNTILKNGCVMTMVAIANHSGHGEAIEGWIEVIRTGVATEDWQTSALRFRDWWLTTPHNGGANVRVGYCRRIFSSMLAWKERRGLTKLYEAKSITWLDETGK